MKTIEGYSKEKYTNTSVLLAGGGAKALSDFIGSLSWDSTNKKIKYTPVEGSAIDLVTLSWDNIANKPTSLPANGGDADTVDGYHASSFYKIKSLRSDVDSIYSLRWNYGGYDKGDYNGTYKDEYPTWYGAYLALTYNDKNSGALMFIDTPTSNVLGHVYVRTRGAGDWNTTYSEWGTLAYLTDNVASSSKWETARTITLTGSVTGSVSIDGSGDVSLATTTNHTHNYAGSSSAGGSANSALTLLYNNKFDTIYGDYAIFQQNYNISDFPHNGWFNSIKMLHNNSYGYFTEIATSFTGEEGMWRRALQGGTQVGWYKMLDSGNFNSYAPSLTGAGASGTWNIHITGGLTIQSIYSETDINSNYLKVYAGVGDAWTGEIGSMAYSAILGIGDPSRGFQLWAQRGDGTMGCLHYRVGTFDAHSWNTERTLIDNETYNLYSPKLDGTGASGIWGISISGNAATATNAENISSIYPQLAASLEADEINVKRQIDWNNWGGYGYKLEAAIDFNWYETHNLFGVIRGSNTDSAGFGWMYSSDGSTYTPIARLSPDGHLYLASSLTISGAISGVTDITASGHAKVNSLKTQYICIECDNSGNSSSRGSEINNYSSTLYLQYDTSNSCCICYGGGNVGIGTTSPSSKLHVVGDIYTTTGFKKEGSSDSYVLLGGGGHKLISDFAAAGHTHDGRYLRYEGWWNSGSGQNVDDANGMTFVYGDHGSPNGWGILCTFDYTYNSGYKFQLFAEGYSADGMYYRCRSSDRGGWTSWKTVIDSGNIGSQSVNYASSAGNADTAERANYLSGHSSSPDNSHPGHGARVFYSWDIGSVGNATSGYSTGITIGSHPSDTGYGFQIVQNLWDDRTYTRRYNKGWQEWKTLAWTSDIPTKISQLTNDSGYITSSGSCNYATSAGNADSAGSAERARYLTCPDTRSSAPAPGDYTATSTGVSFDFKESSVTGLSGYSGVMTFRPYSSAQDWTGGEVHQIAFLAGGGLYHRIGTSSWGSWERILTSSNWSSYISIPSVGNDTNYYPIRSYTSGLQISSYSGSTDCALFVPYAASNQAGVVSTEAQIFSGQKTFSSIRLSTTNFGGYLYFGDDSYAYLAELADDQLTLNATKIFLGISGSQKYYIDDTVFRPVTANSTSSSGIALGSSDYRFTCGYFSDKVYAYKGFYESSDERLKNILNPVKVNLDDLSKLRKVYYLWKDRTEDEIQLGMIAQDVQKLYPELVSVDKETGYLSLAYDKLSVLALEAIDVLYKEHKKLKKHVDELEKLLINNKIS